ncbi:DUF6455 family protein [Actibacterium lipolyticum]|uniref:DUF6455 domain-containing protein n=1 Tax=Actibacterium lipolyticum TaxID=1524263 RepID=A0A238JMG2_9RHOB|nr:DUF6455 family protein [Actibacterium lipolyticum]SMX31831.1 hypothetical protein COL8621_00620 [Actibacterium lipolyticum]
MPDCSKLSLHFWLTQSMARTIGVNLHQALVRGQFARSDYTQTIAECMACAQTEKCVPWLAKQGAGADHLPDYCALKSTLEALKP